MTDKPLDLVARAREILATAAAKRKAVLVARFRTVENGGLPEPEPEAVRHARIMGDGTCWDQL